MRNGKSIESACIEVHSCEEMPKSEREYKGRRLSQLQWILAKDGK
jgi:hypothetical protein